MAVATGPSDLLLLDVLVFGYHEFFGGLQLRNSSGDAVDVL